MWQEWTLTETHTGRWWVNLKESDHLEDLDINTRKILKWILNGIGGHAVDSYG